MDYVPFPLLLSTPFFIFMLTTQRNFAQNVQNILPTFNDSDQGSSYRQKKGKQNKNMTQNFCAADLDL